MISRKWDIVVLCYLTRQSWAETIASYYRKIVHSQRLWIGSMKQPTSFLKPQNINLRFHQFHRALLLSQSGITQYIDKKYKPSSSMCSTLNLKSKESQQTRIQMREFWGIFLILFIGYLMGIVVYIEELLRFNYHRHHR